MTRDQHLEHLVSLMAPPFQEAWRAHCWHRAKELARDPEMADLPRLLTEAMRPQPDKATSTTGKEIP